MSDKLWAWVAREQVIRPITDARERQALASVVEHDAQQLSASERRQQEIQLRNAHAAASRFKAEKRSLRMKISVARIAAHQQPRQQYWVQRFKAPCRS